MRWEAIEDKVCCLIFIKNHVRDDLNLLTSIQEALYFGVNKKEGSIRMKFNNIATLCDDYGIRTSNKVKRLSNYSKQNHDQFIDVKDLSAIDISTELNKIKTTRLK